MLKFAIAFGLGFAACYWRAPLINWVSGTAWPWLKAKVGR